MATTARHRVPHPDSLELRPEDFEGVRYNVELVHVTNSDASNDEAFGRTDAVDLALPLLLALALLAGCVALGVAVDWRDFAGDALWVLLPMLVVPIAWLAALHLYEKRVTVPSPQAIASMVPPKIATT